MAKSSPYAIKFGNKQAKTNCAYCKKSLADHKSIFIVALGPGEYLCSECGKNPRKKDMETEN